MQQSKPRNQSDKKQSNLTQGTLRIIGGQMRGRKLQFATVDGLRPTLDRIRETLFNWLIADIHQAHCLDLFAGSGALGFEAISRGAVQLTFVEKSPKVVIDLKKNCQLLAIENAKIVNQSFEKFLHTNQQQFNLVFLDPPFGQAMLTDIEARLTPHLMPGALIYVEHEKNTADQVDFSWDTVKSKQTGSLVYSLYRYGA
ncbi:16S rRNA (guanine(966)-N(2))-methyltransferase RsmD [Aliikangiella maris]|uniref:16S rRNA (Guanine(966)-N(2))-methyltransferase RsmD n=2 Tax=Aliikangiella maris TaxID=3162458 RepID=A0ABV3MRU7_9GAMM